jgi:hypothetical protein
MPTAKKTTKKTTKATKATKATKRPEASKAKAAKVAKAVKPAKAAPKKTKPAAKVKAKPKIIDTIEDIGEKALELLGLDDLNLLEIIGALARSAVIVLTDDIFHPKHRNSAVKTVMDAIKKRPDCKFVVKASSPGRLKAYANAFGLPDNLEVKPLDTV